MIWCVCPLGLVSGLKNPCWKTKKSILLRRPRPRPGSSPPGPRPGPLQRRMENSDKRQKIVTKWRNNCLFGALCMIGGTILAWSSAELGTILMHPQQQNSLTARTSGRVFVCRAQPLRQKSKNSSIIFLFFFAIVGRASGQILRKGSPESVGC